MSSRPHLLYTAWSFPPSRAGGVYRALATVNAFADAGWDVTVITVPRSIWVDSTGADEHLEAQVRSGVRVVRVEPDVPAYQNDITRWPRARARYSELWRIADFRRDFLRFPEPNYGRWRPALQAAAERVHDEHPVDLAIGTANPHVDFVPGWHVNRRFGVPYVMDYRDAWILDVFSGRQLITAVPPVHVWERRLMSSAAEIWFVNDAIRGWHAERYPQFADRMKVVANGYDRYDAPLEVPVRPDRTSGLVFGYIGTVSDKVPIVPLIDGWRLARAQEPALAEARLVIHGYLGHFGVVKPELADALERGKADGVSYEGPVSKSKIGETYRGFDALVLALGTGRYVTSGKVYEYAATGMPIAAVHDPGNAATEVLRESPVVVPVRSLDPADIATALAETARRAATQSEAERAAAQQWATRYERRAQLAPRIASLTPGEAAPASR